MVEKVAQFCIKSAKIPDKVLERMLENFKMNDKTKNSIESLDKQLSNITGESKDKEKKDSKGEKDPRKNRT